MDERDVLWNRKYFDVAYNFHQVLSRAGLESLPKQLVASLDLPSRAFGQGTTLFRRCRRWADQQAWLERQEETLNDVFDLAFGIAPDTLIEACFLRPLGFQDAGPFLSHGLEVKHRFGWNEENVVQQDGFFSSVQSLVAVELKIGDTISAAQIAKYIFLLSLEEEMTGQRDQAGLVLIAPHERIAKNLSAINLAGDQDIKSLDEGFADTSLGSLKSGRVRRRFEEAPEVMADLTKRLKFTAISWESLVENIESYCRQLDPDRPGDLTLLRLAAGLCDQIKLQVPSAGRSPEAGTGR